MRISVREISYASPPIPFWALLPKMPRVTIHKYVTRKPIVGAVAANLAPDITHRPMIGAVPTKLAGDAGNLSSRKRFIKKERGLFRKIEVGILNNISWAGPRRLRGPGQATTAFGPRVIKYGSKGKDTVMKKCVTLSKLPPVIEAIRDISQLRKKRDTARSEGKRVAFVPTMGALHRGHLRLIHDAAINNDEVYVSIYVNPTQFGVHEDLDSYPQTWEKDMKQLHALNADIINRAEFKGQITTVFKPSTTAMYPTLPPTSRLDGQGSFVNITPLSSVLEGASRPIFFRGVATVVMKLLNIVQPDEVMFGQKDIQQVLVIRRMIADFHLNTVMRVVPTQREDDGLAMSSRNVNLGTRRRAVATVLYQALQAANAAFESGKRTRDQILDPAIDVAAKVQQAQRHLPPGERARFEIDYLSMADPDNLEEVQVVEEGKPVILSGAVIMLPLEDRQRGENVGLIGGTTAVRLIDNMIFFRDKIFPRRRRKKGYLVKRLGLRAKGAPSIELSPSTKSAGEVTSTDHPSVSA